MGWKRESRAEKGSAVVWLVSIPHSVALHSGRGCFGYDSIV